MANYHFSPRNASWRNFEIVPSFDGSRITSIERNFQSLTGLNIKYSGYSKEPIVPGYSSTSFEYSGDITFDITADSSFEANLPTGGIFGVVGFLGDNYLALLATFLYESGGTIYYQECYNVGESGQTGNTTQTTINYDSSGQESSRNTITHTEGMIGYNNTMFRGRWWPPVENSFGSNSGRDTLLLIECNFPIFENTTQALNYLFTGDLTGCVNLKGELDVDETTRDYYIYNRFEMSKVERGIVTPTEVTVHQANERILYNGEDIALYRDETNPFKLSIKMGGGLVGSKYSATSVSDVSGATYDEFTLDELIHSTPFYSTYNSSLGVTEYEGYLALGLSTNIPIWDNEDDADDYLAGDKDITDATNWNKISQDTVWSNTITNLTEEPETTTQFGEVYTRAFFSQMYLCNTATLYKISNALFDYDVTTLSGLWEDIKKGTEMYGTNPMEVVQGLRYYPFDLSQVFTNVENSGNVWIGAYNLNLDGDIAKKVIYQNGYINLGTMRIRRTFKDWRDFEPYTNLYIYLPYVGRYALDLRRYYDKDVNIRYYIDLRTGACVACLIADGVLLDWFDGIIGTEMPITLTDYSSYAQSQLSIIMRNAGIGTGGAGYLGNKGIGIAKKQYQIHQELGDLASKQYSSAYEGAYKSIANYQLANGGTVNLAGTETAAGVMAQQASAASAAGASKAGALAGAGVAAAGVAAAGAVAIVGMKTAFELTQSGTAGFTRARTSSSAMINQFLPQYPTFIFEVQEIDESEYLNELYGRPSNASGRLGDFSGYLEAEDIMLICPIATDNEREEIINLVKAGIYI